MDVPLHSHLHRRTFSKSSSLCVCNSTSTTTTSRDSSSTSNTCSHSSATKRTMPLHVQWFRLLCCCVCSCRLMPSNRVCCTHSLHSTADTGSTFPNIGAEFVHPIICVGASWRVSSGRNCFVGPCQCCKRLSSTPSSCGRIMWACCVATHNTTHNPRHGRSCFASEW